MSRPPSRAVAPALPAPDWARDIHTKADTISQKIDAMGEVMKLREQLAVQVNHVRRLMAKNAEQREFIKAQADRIAHLEQYYGSGPTTRVG